MTANALLAPTRQRWILPLCDHCQAPVQNLPVKGRGGRFDAPRVGSVLCLKCGCRAYFRTATWIMVDWSPETGEFVPSSAHDA